MEDTMVITQRILGQRLQNARKSKGLTQQQAASSLGISRETVAQIEAGARSVNSLEIARLSHLYDRSLSLLLMDEEQVEEPLNALFQIHQTLSTPPELQEQLGWLINLFQEARLIERLLGEEPKGLPPDYGLRDPRNAAEAYEQGQELARQERQRLGLGVIPMTNVAEAIFQQGVWAVSAELPNNVSGLCLVHPSIGAAIIVNNTHEPSRRRFAYAHQYAHLLANRKSGAAFVSRIDNSKELGERRANSFASEFLIPAASVTDWLDWLDKGNPSRETRWLFDPAIRQADSIEKRHAPGSQEIAFHDIVFMAGCFRVSFEATAYRLSDLGKINSDRLQSLLSQQTEQQKEETDHELSLLESYVRWLAWEAYRREAISGGRFCEFCALARLDADEEYVQVRERFGE